MKKFSTLILAVFILTTFTFFALGSGSDSSSVSSGDGDSSVKTTEGTKELTANVGDVLTTESLKITYVSCEEYKNYSEYSKPKSGNIIYKLSFNVENIGTTDRFVSYMDFKCYADNVATEAYYSVDDDLSATVSSGRAAKGNVYFEVPKNAEKVEVEYETDFWTGGKAIFTVK